MYDTRNGETSRQTDHFLFPISARACGKGWPGTISPWPAMPYPSMPCGRATSETALFYPFEPPPPSRRTPMNGRDCRQTGNKTLVEIAWSRLNAGLSAGIPAVGWITWAKKGGRVVGGGGEGWKGGGRAVKGGSVQWLNKKSMALDPNFQRKRGMGSLTHRMP
jgi:hypothetical protein